MKFSDEYFPVLMFLDYFILNTQFSFRCNYKFNDKYTNHSIEYFLMVDEFMQRTKQQKSTQVPLG